MASLLKSLKVAGIICWVDQWMNAWMNIQGKVLAWMTPRAVPCCHCWQCFLKMAQSTRIVNLLLCLIYKLNMIINVYVKEKNSTAQVEYLFSDMLGNRVFWIWDFFWSGDIYICIRRSWGWDPNGNTKFTCDSHTLYIYSLKAIL
jgi:hypothetical protein